MAECTECGSHVSSDYARLFGDGSTVDVCPHCDDYIRDGDGRKRRARSTRRSGDTDVKRKEARADD